MYHTTQDHIILIAIFYHDDILVCCNMDLNQLPTIHYGSVIDIKIVSELKLRARSFLIRTYGEELYHRILNSPLPFIHPHHTQRTIYIYIYL